MPEKSPQVEPLQWPDQESSELLQFQKSLWELASAVSAEHALSMPVDRKRAQSSPSVPSYEPDWLTDVPNAAAAPPQSAQPQAAPAAAEAVPTPPDFAAACQDIEDLMAKCDSPMASLNKNG